MKQYLLLVNEEGRVGLEKIFKGLEFLEVQGLNVNGDTHLQMLATPIYLPVTQATVPSGDNPDVV